MTPREIDVMIAEKVMGWHAKDNAYWWNPDHNTTGYTVDGGFYDFEPSTDIAAAWEVVEKILSDGKDFTLDAWQRNGRRECRIHINDAYKTYADTAPMAICKAALRAVGVEVE